MARQKKIENRDSSLIDIKSCKTLASWKGRRIGWGPLFSVPYRVLRTRNGSVILEGPDSVMNSSFILWRVFFPRSVYNEYSIPEVVSLMFETGRAGKRAARRAFPVESEHWAHFAANLNARAEL